MTNAMPVVADEDLSETIVYRMLADHLQDKYVWVRGLAWYRWTGSRWESVSDDHVRDVTARWVRSRYLDALTDANGEMTGSAMGTAADWEKYQNRGKIDSIRSMAKGALEIQAGDLDRDPDLLNCTNGTVDLRTGELRTHDPRDYITKTTGHDYTPDPWHADWEEALAAVPADVLPWLKVKFGQGITGHTPDDDRVLFLHGSGANGKSTIIAAIASAIGDYYHVAAPRAVLAPPGAHSTELADFRGARFAVLEELPDRGLSVTRVKTLAGTQKITARHIAKDSVVFDASHTMFVTTNHHPQVTETDHGTWRRLTLVKFPYTFTEDPDPAIPTQRKGDPGLRQRITAGDGVFASAVLAWLVEGAREWYAAGQITPEPPELVARDTQAWRMESDIALRFWNDCLDASPGTFMPSADLYLAYTEWADNHDLPSIAPKVLFPKLAAHEIAEQHGVSQVQIRTANLADVSRHPKLAGTKLKKIARGWTGITLKSQPQG